MSKAEVRESKGSNVAALSAYAEAAVLFHAHSRSEGMLETVEDILKQRFDRVAAKITAAAKGNPNNSSNPLKEVADRLFNSEDYPLASVLYHHALCGLKARLMDLTKAGFPSGKIQPQIDGIKARLKEIEKGRHRLGRPTSREAQ